MMVPDRRLQHDVMREAVANHFPDSEWPSLLRWCALLGSGGPLLL